ncbi:MAG: SH3-like domain-containing protein [Pseudomonadota bacterium]|jgi:nitrile hydratase
MNPLAAAPRPACGEPRFVPGDRVRVLDLPRPGHVRTPHYVRHKVGTVVEYTGLFLNPEDLAYGRCSGPAVNGYRVVFDQSHLWRDYRGSGSDRLFIELYEHWLERA